MSRWYRSFWTLLIAAAGGEIATILALPLPWIFGALVITLLVTLKTPALKIEKELTLISSVVWGLLIGSYVNPELLGKMATWWPSLLGLVFFVSFATYCSFRIARRKYDLPTAYFMSIPGGLNETFTMGTACGGDGRVIVVTQSLRAFFIVTLLPWILRFALPEIAVSPLSQASHSVSGYFFLLVGTLTVPLALKLGWPAPWMLGAAFGSAITHGTGLTSERVPNFILIPAQLIIGAGIGLGFKGFAWREIKTALGTSLTMTLFSFCLGALFAEGMSLLCGYNMYEVLVSYTPGGIATMSIVAATYGLSVPFVAINHVVRLVMILAGAPTLFNFYISKARR